LSASFTMEFLGDHIRILHPDNYEITPESQEQLWLTIGEACEHFNCCRVLAESSTPPKRNMTEIDAFRSAGQAAKATKSSGELRLAILFKGYNPDKTTEFFLNSAYNMGIRIEFFSDRKEAAKWLGINDAPISQ
jgi:hypothetical protein